MTYTRTTTAAEDRGLNFLCDTLNNGIDPADPAYVTPDKLIESKVTEYLRSLIEQRRVAIDAMVVTNYRDADAATKQQVRALLGINLS